MKKIIIYGVGITGNSLSQELKEKYDIIIYTDKNPKKIDYLLFKNVVGVVRSPGVKHNSPLLEYARKKSIPVYEEIEITNHYYNFSKSKLILVTGTNGKTTLVEWLKNAFLKLGKTAIALGNIGIPISSLISSKIQYQYIILELSSYQLKNFSGITSSGSVVLNISPDHLDWHDNYQDYKLSKLNIFKKSKCIYFFEVEYVYHYIYSNNFFASTFLIYVKANENTIKQQYSLKILPVQNQWLTNLAVFLAITSRELSKEEFKKTLKSLNSICKIDQHKDQLLGVVRGVKIIDDSKGTNTLSVKEALKNYKNTTLILGGDFKKTTISFTQEEKESINAILIFGIAAKELFVKVKHQFNHKIILLITELRDMETISLLALVLGQITKSQYLLFSPGGGSYGEYKNYIERGETFQRCIMQMKKNL